MNEMEKKGAPASSGTVAPRSPWNLADWLWSSWPFGENLPAWREMMSAAGGSIRVEEFVEDGQIVVRAELPGIDPDKDVEVTLDKGVLTIRAERKEEKREESAGGYRSEFAYGRLVRHVRLPEGATTEDVTATYADGILEVRLPAPAAAAPTQRKVEVKRG